MDRGALINLGFAVLALGCAGSVVLAQTTPLDVFQGAKLGMSKAQFVGLPAMKAKPPRCLRFDLPGPPVARDIQSCDLPPDEGSYARRYLFAPDPAGVTRLIAVSIVGHRRGGPPALEGLSMRYGAPTNTTELKNTDGGAIHIWNVGAQQLMLRWPCSAKDDLCLEYTDRPFARQASRAATSLLGVPGDRY